MNVFVSKAPANLDGYSFLRSKTNKPEPIYVRYEYKLAKYSRTQFPSFGESEYLSSLLEYFNFYGK